MIGESAVSIRSATPADAPGVGDVMASALATLRRVYRPTPAAQARRAGRSARPESLCRLVALVDGRIVGTVEYDLIDDRLHFRGLGVHASARGRGIARALVDHLATIARDWGSARLSLYTIRQTGNVAVFERMGFHIVREEPAVDFVSDSHADLIEVYMERAIERSSPPPSAARDASGGEPSP